MLEMLRKITKWPGLHILGENRGVVAPDGFGFHKLVCMRVVISLVFLLCFQNDCIKAAVGDSDPILILGVGFQ